MRVRNPFQAKLEQIAITLLMDSREGSRAFTAQELSPFKVEHVGLPTGDITVKGLDTKVVVEKKDSLAELVNNFGAQRARWDREVQRLLAYPSRLLVICDTWDSIDLHNYPAKSRLSANHIYGSLAGLAASGLPWVFAGDRRRAIDITKRFLYVAANREWRVARAFAAEVLSDDNQAEAGA